MRHTPPLIQNFAGGILGTFDVSLVLVSNQTQSRQVRPD